MEAILVQSSPDQSISPYKQIKNPKRNTRSFISRRTDQNLAPTPTNIHGAGGFMFFPPPSLSYSYPPSSFPLHSHQHRQQPPLLPLPITGPHNSLPPRNRKPNRTRDQSLTPKKSKKPTKTKETIATQQQVISAEESLIVSSTNPLGPDPNDIPKDIIKVLSSSTTSIAGNNNSIITKDIEKFSGSIFTISPPPSSLPLPKFSIRPRPEFSCNAEAAAGIDAGATDNLRRLLRLR